MAAPTGLPNAVILKAIDCSNDGIVITAGNKPNRPIVYVNEAFCRLTGYSREDIIGRDCRFLQGPLIETVRTRPVPYQAKKTHGRNTPAGPTSRKVVMYSAAWCGVCKRAKSYFQTNRIAFSEKDIDKSEMARREFEKLGGRGVPLILIGKRRLSGFSPASFEQLYRH